METGRKGCVPMSLLLPLATSARRRWPVDDYQLVTAALRETVLTAACAAEEQGQELVFVLTNFHQVQPPFPANELHEVRKWI